MASKLKELMVEELAGKFAGIRRQGCVVVGYKGLKGEDSAQVRRLIVSKGAGMTVVRNRLFAIALDQIGVSELQGLLDGPSAVISAEDPIHAAQAARDAAQICPALHVLGGYADGHVLDAAGVEKLANLPGRDVLLGQALTCMCYPAQRFVNGLTAVARRLVSVLEQLRAQRQEESPGQGG